MSAASVIARMRAEWQEAKALAEARLTQYGIEPLEAICSPPSPTELRNDYWFAAGMLAALEDLIEELEGDHA